MLSHACFLALPAGPSEPAQTESLHGPCGTPILTSCGMRPCPPPCPQESVGHHVLSAYAEVVFDNSDGRLPVDRQEVRLRRSIGMKKDDYYLDKRHIT